MIGQAHFPDDGGADHSPAVASVGPPTLGRLGDLASGDAGDGGAARDEEPLRSFAALVAAMERLAEAVVRHDPTALETATTTAGELVARIERLAGDGVEPAASVNEAALEDLARRLEASARLAAHLIERAWHSEAAAIGLLARSLGAARDRAGHYLAAGDGSAVGHLGPSDPTVVERRA